MRTVTGAALIAAMFVSTLAPASGPGRNTRYRVEEVLPPPGVFQPCLSEYGNFMSGTDINDFGVVGGNHSCHTRVDPATGIEEFKSTPFVWASRFGALQLQGSGAPGSIIFGSSLNNRGEVFGAEVKDGSTWAGVRWSLTGGFETVLDAPQCLLNLNVAIAGNARHIVGWTSRPNPALPPPFDTDCFTIQWVIKTASGTEILGPLNGYPTDMNAPSDAVGTLENSAIRYSIPTGQVRVLRAGDSTHRVIPNDINDLGEVAGFVGTDTVVIGCGTGLALRWDRNDRETVLPALPGATSSQALGVGYDGETVGNSGPGAYCFPDHAMREHAVLWRGGRALDLNDAIRTPHVKLASAISTNRRGQILAFGYRDDDALRICPQLVFDPETGASSLDLTQRCRYQRLYVLTPL